MLRDMWLRLQPPDTDRSGPIARHATGVADRLESLDAMRGLTVAGMILVNNPGSWTEGYPWLAHSAWNGCTLADLVFPSFLLIVGVSIDLSLSRRLAHGAAGRPLFMALLRRALLLFTLGVLLNGFPAYTPLSTLRLFGVLQRIGLCSLAGGILFLTTGGATQALIAALLLVGYWLALAFVAVPGAGAGVLEPHANLVGWVDDWLFHGHLYRENFDPEGLLSTLPAIATTLIGMLAGRWLRSPVDGRRKTLGLALAGVALAAAGAVADHWLPINKQLWTSSFVLLAGGAGLVALAGCYWLVDRRGWRRVSHPFVMLGANALAVYLLSTMVARLMELCLIGAGDTCESLRLFLYERLFEPWAGALTGSLLFAVAYLLVWMVPTTELYRRRLFLRI